MKKIFFPFLLLCILSIVVSCSKDENQAVPTYNVSYQSKVSSNFTQQITFSQAKGVKSTINNIPGNWNSSTSAEFTSGDSVFIQVKAIPVAESTIKDTLFLSVKTLNPDNASEVKFATSTVKNNDGSMSATLGVKLK